MKYSRTKRSGVLFVFLNIITLTVFSWFSLSAIREEINSFLDEDEKKAPHYFPMWLLGFLSFGVVPIAYEASLARKIDAKAKKLGLASSTSFANFFNLAFFGSLFVFGPWIAFSRMFKTLNRVETKLNDLSSEPVEEEAKSEDVDANSDVIDEKPEPNEIKIRFSSGRKVSEKAKWRVVDRETGEVLTFATQAEAISHAVSVAKKRGVGVKVNGRVDKRAR